MQLAERGAKNDNNHAQALSPLSLPSFLYVFSKLQTKMSGQGNESETNPPCRKYQQLTSALYYFTDKWFVGTVVITEANFCDTNIEGSF